MIFILASCSTPTETPKGDLTGTVNLQGLSDHSGITITLYDLAYLDTTIVRINNQYPQIGVHIYQHTEFDHRLQSPVKSVETLSDGSFELSKIPTGTYNLVAMKADFGFKYMCEIEINEGDNELSQQIDLFEELNISGNISDDIVVAPDHHLIIDDDTVFIPGSSLTIHPGAIIRINPGADLTIHGNLLAQGEENNMFWITSNDGFENSQRTTHNLTLSNREIGLYNSMELSSIATVENDLITWGKWDYANTCLLNQVNNLHVQNGIFRNGRCGLYSVAVDSTFCGNLLAQNCFGESEGGIKYLNINDGEISNSIFCNSFNGIITKLEFKGIIKLNYFYNNNNGIEIWDNNGIIEHNYLERNSHCDVHFTLNHNIITDTLKIMYNSFYSGYNILHFHDPSFNEYSEILFDKNNFYATDYFLYTHGTYNSNNAGKEIKVISSFFKDCFSIQEIEEKVWDCEDGIEYYMLDVHIINFQFDPIDINLRRN